MELLNIHILEYFKFKLEYYIVHLINLSQALTFYSELRFAFGIFTIPLEYGGGDITSKEIDSLPQTLIF